MEREGNEGHVGDAARSASGRSVMEPERYRDEFYRETARRLRFLFTDLRGRHGEAEVFIEDLRALVGLGAFPCRT